MSDVKFDFPPSLRLKKAVDFKKVFSNPIKSTDKYFTILATQSTFGYPRIGLAIAKKIIRKAVYRNVIKRTVRESFRLERQIIGSIDIVVLARKDANHAPVDVLRKSLSKHWLKLVTKCEPC